MQPPAVPLRIAVLGPQGPSFARALQATLQSWVAQPSRTLQWLDGLQDAGQADLRWLLAWEDADTLSPEQAMQALAAHQALRQGLHVRALSYQVLRGSHPEQQAQALSSLRPWLPELATLLPATGVASRRPGWSCSECGDPECEQRSFTALLASRGGP
jgi:hypothetical protein